MDREFPASLFQHLIGKTIISVEPNHSMDEGLVISCIPMTVSLAQGKLIRLEFGFSGSEGSIYVWT